MKRTHQRQKHENAVGSLATCYFQHTLPLCEQSMSAQVESARFFQISNDRMAVGFRVSNLLGRCWGRNVGSQPKNDQFSHKSCDSLM